MDSIGLLIGLFGLFIGVLIMANLADREQQAEPPTKTWTALTYLVLLFFWGGMFATGLLATLAGLVAQTAPEIMAPSFSDDPAANAELFATLPQVGMGLWLPAIFGVLFLLPPIRRLCARFLNIEADRLVHAVALSFTMLIVANLWVTVAFGLDTLADTIAQGPELGANELVRMTWVQELLFAVTAIFGVGWMVHRGWSESIVRLSAITPTLRQALLGLAVGVALALILIPLEYLLDTTGIGYNEDVARISEQLVGPLTESLLGILTLGIAAALGEEFIFRGALQPRFGILLTAVLFALLHSNYGITLSTLIVLLVGLVLGVIRRRYNTSTSMIVHATYNISLGLIAYFSLIPEW